MSENYSINWSDNADNDLAEIIEYIADENSPDQALKILYKIKKNSDKLYKFPDRYRHVPELQKHNILTYRELIVEPWRIIYKIDEDTVWIITVIDGRRNVEDILLKKLLSGDI